MEVTDAGHVLVGPAAATIGQLHVVSATGGTPAIYGESANRGVWGKSTGASRGVYGESVSGEGVYGISVSGSGVSGATTVANTTQAGVVGKSTGIGGAGVIGEATTGVYGRATSASGIGVTGQADLGSGYGVYGTSASATGQGVHGDTTGAGGYGVYAKNNSGTALGVEGHAQQSLEKGGLVKAMLYVNADGTVNRCFNSQRLDGGDGAPPSGTAGCGFAVTHTTPGYYHINFGFDVSHRFYAVTPQTGGAVNIIANYYFVGNVNFIGVVTAIPDVDWNVSQANNPFMIIVY